MMTYCGTLWQKVTGSMTRCVGLSSTEAVQNSDTTRMVLNSVHIIIAKAADVAELLPLNKCRVTRNLPRGVQQ